MTQDSTSIPPGTTPEPSASAPDEVIAPTNAAALVPAPAPASPERRGVSGTGPQGKTRSPIGGWLLLIPTFGIYYLFWYHNINRELRDYDPSVEVKPDPAGTGHLRWGTRGLWPAGPPGGDRSCPERPVLQRPAEPGVARLTLRAP